MTAEQFHVARYNGILAVMKKDRDQYFKLQQKYDRLLSEHNILKIQYLEMVEDCLDKRDKNRKKIKGLKDEYNKLLEQEQNKRWNEL